MTRLEPTDRIEGIVGVKRDDVVHFGRAVSSEQRVYILHSRECLASVSDQRDCEFSLALDNGIDPDEWVEDVPVILRRENGRLVPARVRHLLSDPDER